MGRTQGKLGPRPETKGARSAPGEAAGFGTNMGTGMGPWKGLGLGLRLELGRGPG